jgi:Leucine-rich repeat (LRR) protein
VFLVVGIVAVLMARSQKHNAGTPVLPSVASSTVAVKPFEDTCMYTSDLAAAEKDPMNVCSLNLFGQQLTEIPPAVFTMKNLTYLDLADNNITTIPPDIGNLTNLKWLYLNQNEITSIPDTINQLKNLQFFTIEYDKVTLLPNDLSGMANMQLLIVQGNPLPPAEVSRAKQTLPNAKITF